MTAAITSPPAAPGSLTISQVLALDRQVCLYGLRISDLSPRGELGLGLDPEGPVGFAHIRGYRHQGNFRRLAQPLMPSVFGQGRACEPSDADALLGERVWQLAMADRLLKLEMQQGGLAAFLGVD
jgi:hypothetical protein